VENSVKKLILFGTSLLLLHRGLPSGEKLELLESSEENSYSRVRTDRGIEGWLPSHYLVDKPVARSLLGEANRRAEELNTANKALREQLQNTVQNTEQTSSIASEVSEQNKSLSQELEDIKRTAASAIKLDEDNRRLLESNQMLSNEVDVLKTDNTRLRENEENEFFLNGAFAVLIGVMLTLIIPRMMPKRRSDWG
jgi:SH3 domain protein